MLRCDICGGHAVAGLAHLHGLGVHLCNSCTQIVLTKQEKHQRPLSLSEARARMRNKAA